MHGLKTTIWNFFRDKRALEMADFIAVKIEGTGKYYIHKHRGCNAECIYDKNTFFDVLSTVTSPIVLNDRYIDLSKELSKQKEILK